MLIDPHAILPTLQWQLQGKLRTLAGRLDGLGLDMQLTSGVRSCAAQNALYAQGRTAPGSVVTQAQGCVSWHVQGRAVDATLFLKGGGEAPDSDYRRAGELWRNLGGKWGGDFPGFYDRGHFEFRSIFSIERLCPKPELCDSFHIQTKAPLWIPALAVALGTGAGLGAYYLYNRYR